MRKLSWWLVSIAFAGCGGDDSPAKTPDAAIEPDAPPSETLGAAPELAMACNDSMADVYVLPTGLPTMDDSHRGDVFRCSTGESLSAYKVNKQIAGYNEGFTNGQPGHATSGFWTFRIAYRSERNTFNNARAEGDTAAFLLVPDKPVTGAPLIVFGHGSVGVAPKCAPTHLDLAGAVQDQDYPPALYRLAGAGYTVIAPDYNGSGFGQTPGYFNAEDEAHAILDATRAAAKTLKTPPTKVAFVGHSQGGHAVIAAQSYAEAYGMTGQLVGVATLAPYWLSLSLFAAAATDFSQLSTTAPADLSSIVYAMAYAYSELELREGPGKGLEVFQTAKQTAARDAILSECYNATAIAALGAKPSDFFEAGYVQSVGGACALQGSCADPLAAKWKNYWISERPKIDTTGAPLLVFSGSKDSFITTGRAQCGRDALDGAIALDSGATTTVTYCSDPSTTHREFIRRDDVDYALQWIASKAGIAAAPAACTAPDVAFCGSIPQDY